MVAATEREARLERENADLRQALEAHRQTLQHIYQVIHLPNKKAQPGEKLYLIASRCILPDEKPDEDGMSYLPTDKFSEFIGMSETTTYRYGHSLIDRYEVPYKEVPFTTLKKQERNLTYIDREHPLWKEPWNAPLPEEKERVINGNKCPNCKKHTYYTEDTLLASQRRKYCTSCGIEHVWPVKYGPKSKKPGTYLHGKYVPPTPKKGLQAEEPFGGDEIEDGENTDGALTYPSTPPPVSFSPAQREQEAAQLLLDIAGPSASHIVMTNRTPDKDGKFPTSKKYITVEGPLTVADTLAHIRGEKTVGDYLRYEGEQTRAACYDADNPADWQRLQDAARLLACVGFKPFLEACPMDCASGSLHAGGGRLWVIIDALVDAYSLHQTLYQYAPLLKDIKESWPAPGGSRTRLPGGKYRQGARAEWCKLYDANAQELSADGPGAARVLLENQASANLVNEYVKPEPVILPERTERAQGQGGYLDSDLVKRVIADFNATHSWATIAGLCGGFNKRGFFLATWRNERNPSVSVFDKTDMAKDFGVKEPSMDRYDVWCRIHGGAQWEAWKKRDVAERCQAIRDAQEQGQSASPPLTAPVNERPATPIPTPSDALFADAPPDPSYRAYYEQMGKWA